MKDLLDKQGGPAFPSGVVGVDGMTLRDFFAAKAMQAIITNSDRQSTSVSEVVGWVGSYAYDVADAMLVERAK